MPLRRLALRLCAAECAPCGSIDVDGTGFSVAARRRSASSSSSCLVVEVGQFKFSDLWNYLSKVFY